MQEVFQIFGVVWFAFTIYLSTLFKLRRSSVILYFSIIKQSKIEKNNSKLAVCEHLPSSKITQCEREGGLILNPQAKIPSLPPLLACFVLGASPVAMLEWKIQLCGINLIAYIVIYLTGWQMWTRIAFKKAMNGFHRQVFFGVL